MQTYIVGRQITIDEHLTVRAEADCTLGKTLVYAVKIMKDELCRIWPYSKDLKYVLNLLKPSPN